MKKARIISLGCAKNLVDTERLMYALKEQGYDFTPFEEEADLILVNTCAFIAPACEEAEENIKSLEKFKKEGKELIVCGCYVERYKEKIKEKFPFVDKFLDLKSYENLGIKEDKRFRVTPKHWSYVKISEGCINFCSYCTIPYIRGPLRSRPIENIEKEIKELVHDQVKEIILIAQDTTRYGEDLYGKPSLLDLLKVIERLKGDFFVRILYMYPTRLTQELLSFIKSSDRIVPYFDIPLQHVNDKILKLMRRTYSKDDIIKLYLNIRETFPESVIRTTFIVGFPGEEEEDFNELLYFIEKFTFERLGAFTYYPEEGTLAYNFDNKVPEEIKKQRLDLLMTKQQKISKKLNNNLLGKEFEVFIEGKIRNGYLARSWREAPEVDPFIIIKDSNRKFNVGDKLKVKIEKAGIYDLWGKVI